MPFQLRRPDGGYPLAARPGSRLLPGAAAPPAARAVPATAMDRSHGTTGPAAQ